MMCEDEKRERACRLAICCNQIGAGQAIIESQTFSSRFFQSFEVFERLFGLSKLFHS